MSLIYFLHNILIFLYFLIQLSLTLSGTFLLLFREGKLGCYLLVINTLLYGMIAANMFNDLAIGIGFGALIAHIAFKMFDVAEEIVFFMSKLACIGTFITYGFIFFNWNSLKDD